MDRDAVSTGPAQDAAPVSESSIWPMVLAGGLTLLLFGVPTSLPFSVVGAGIMAIALRGWIGELRHG
jgi:hypothetical protein